MQSALKSVVRVITSPTGTSIVASFSSIMYSG